MATSGRAAPFLALALILGMLLAPHAKASPACEHRSAEHAAQHHQSREADSRWHVMHGERPTCGLDDKGSSSHHEDHSDDKGPRRDHFGFHCTWHGCG